MGGISVLKTRRSFLSSWPFDLFIYISVWSFGLYWGRTMGDLQGGEWEEFMANIQKSYQGKEVRNNLLSSLFSSLTKILEKKSALHWHIESLGRCIRERMNPIGLRIQIFPILENISKELKNNWESKMNDCSINLMLLLQNEYRQQLESMNAEISILYNRLAPLKQHEEYVVYEKKLKDHLETFGKAILLQKRKILERQECFQRGYTGLQVEHRLKKTKKEI